MEQQFQVQEIKHPWFNIPVRFEIVKCTRRRELAFLKPVNIRALNLYKIDQLPFLFKRAEFDIKKPNMYISNALLSKMPIFTFSPFERQKMTSEWFRNDFFKDVAGYDIFLDFDLVGENDSWDAMINEIKEFLGFVREYKVPYYLIFSGNRGFQFVIPYEYLPSNLNFVVDEYGKGLPGSVYDFTKIFIEKCKEIFSLHHLDLSGNGIPNKLRKCPYSLVGDNVALPLTDFDLENWKLEKMHYEFILKRTLIKNRGLLTRDYGLSQVQLKDNLSKFIKEFNLD